MVKLVKATLISSHLILAASLGFSIAQADDSPVPDPSLENRLVITKTYKVRSRDTLRRVARLLYNHSSWWSKLRSQNEDLEDYGPDQALPLGKRIRFLAPRIGAKYTIQKGDWLVRIAIWKYGSIHSWKKLSNLVGENPNLIQPGQVLVFNGSKSRTLAHIEKAPIKVKKKEIKRVPAEKGTPDPALEKRLKVARVYHSRRFDTLEKLSRLLYNHRSWWGRLRDENLHLKSFGPKDNIPEKTVIFYKAPKIGRQYTVQNGDWLIRIAIWKYGSLNFWEKLFQSNAGSITNPDLIHPGDILVFGSRGQVQLTSIDGSDPKVILQGVPPAKGILEEFANVGRTVSSTETVQENNAWLSLTILLAGLLLFVFAGLLLRAKRFHKSPFPFPPETIISNESPKEKTNDTLPRDGDQVDIDPRKMYQSLSPKWWKKYLARPKNRE